MNVIASKLFYKDIESYVIDSFGDNQVDIIHLQRTAYWVQKLDSKADEALLVAAVSHDIERAFRETLKTTQISSKSFLDEEDLRHHQEKGASIISKQLTSLDAPKVFIQKVERLISRHELGGYRDENTLKDADSLSFFENNINFFIDILSTRRSKESIEEKFNWMFSRISSPYAKELAMPWYEDAIQRIKVHQG